MAEPFDSQTIRDIEETARVYAELADAGFEPPLYGVCRRRTWTLVDSKGKTALYTRGRLEDRWERRP